MLRSALFDFATTTLLQQVEAGTSHTGAQLNKHTDFRVKYSMHTDGVLTLFEAVSHAKWPALVFEDIVYSWLCAQSEAAGF